MMLVLPRPILQFFHRSHPSKIRGAKNKPTGMHKTVMKGKAIAIDGRSSIHWAPSFLSNKSDAAECRIKARACTDGRPQRLLYDKSEASSPTVKMESVFLTQEGRQVAVYDISGAFLHSELPDIVHMKVRGVRVQRVKWA